ncbi:low molecular weight phosphotyrosine protein phosphatase [Pseudomonas sp. 21LCFQ02]|uniref:low molecular weight protein-tyrosine-phosphatase n=1 Tax=unclassified Pseudomonas TaxID=196821 RepID=UPI0004F778A9|nr:MULTISPECIES: low molecular weight protein-tyrosine-phosphatase [unclassified Pseudomonas]MCO8165827.1 low molecular weight phosphotyrosine protein phosphatase [Pseudomonas sp. 21LCFQ010]MCO8169490.1 low molecular weight phosphotyrosine protein phosphatase [Pseudomonas sp. 21LCFQ02]MCQ9427386.1 low molecular weight phosphotyrosine protein phosphatase [Pseudomonas sp. LJDD11]BAP46154.1 low molecular weight protein-tyrosine-phosphatase [Pseudomonas sp. StFLB209]
MFSELLVVCVGNICRSPMAEAILRDRLADRPISIRSAGLHALTGAPIDGLAREVLDLHGLELPGHRSQQVDRQMLRRADLILSMEQPHLASLFRLAPEVRGKTFLIGQWQHAAEIVDPYKRPRAAFEQTYTHLSRCVDDWLPYIQSGDPNQ